MAATAFANLVDKGSVFLQEYMTANLPEKSVMISSGLFAPDPVMQSVIRAQGGKTVSVPWYKEFTQDQQIPTADTDLTVYSLATNKDIGVVCARAIAPGAEDIAKIFAATDPLAEMGRQWTNYWSRKIDASCIKVLTGTLAAIGSTHQLTTYNTQNFDYTHLLAAVDLQGDNSDAMTIIVCHSKVYHRMKLLKLVNYKDATDRGGGDLIYFGGTVDGRRVYVSDQVPTTGSGDTKVYSTYVAAPGVAALMFQKDITFEPYRLPLKAGGTDVVVSTVHYVPHLYRTQWTGTASGTTPTNTELGTSGNWTSVIDNVKDVPIVELQTYATLA